MGGGCSKGTSLDKADFGSDHGLCVSGLCDKDCRPCMLRRLGNVLQGILNHNRAIFDSTGGGHKPRTVSMSVRYSRNVKNENMTEPRESAEEARQTIRPT